jgi:hypothetical protein
VTGSRIFCHRERVDLLVKQGAVVVAVGD